MPRASARVTSRLHSSIPHRIGSQPSTHHRANAGQGVGNLDEMLDSSHRDPRQSGAATKAASPWLVLIEGGATERSSG